MLPPKLENDNQIGDGCINIFIVFFTLILTVMVWSLLRIWPDFSVQHLWVASTLALIPFAALTFLFLGRKNMSIDEMDPIASLIDPNFFADIIPFYRFVFGWLFVIVLPLFIWAILIGYVNQQSETTLQLLTILAPTGLIIISLLSYGMGGAYMEDRRKFSLVLFGFFEFLYGSQIVSRFFSANDWLTPMFGWGIFLGSLLGILSCRYLFISWDPVELKPRFESRFEVFLESTRLGQLLQSSLFLSLELLLNALDNLFAITFVSIWMLFAIGYMIIQAIRYRPKPTTIYKDRAL